MTYDDVTGGRMARKILKKFNGLITRIELTQAILLSLTEKHAEKFNHRFSHFFIFGNIFDHCNCFDAVTVTSWRYFVRLHKLDIRNSEISEETVANNFEFVNVSLQNLGIYSIFHELNKCFASICFKS